VVSRIVARNWVGQGERLMSGDATNRASQVHGASEPEQRRLAALRESGLLDSTSEEAFDRLTRLAARLCDAPIARVSLVDSDRQVFTSAIGPLPPSGRQTSLSHAICQQVAYGRAELVVTDAREDPRVAESGAVREHGVRAYAGEPLFSTDGECLGALCVVDERRREWTDEQLSALRDLAEVANAEIRLRASLSSESAVAERFADQARLLDLTSDAVLVRGADDVVTFWNRGAERLYGFTAQQAIGCTAAWLFGDDESEDGEAARQALRSADRWEGELRRRAADGREVVVLSRQTMERDAAGEPRRILQIDTDVTERRELEDRLRQVEKMEAMGQLAGGIAHDFNNLLTAISGYCGLAREETGGTLPELDEIARAVDRAGELTSQLLTFSRRQTVRPSELDLEEVASELVPLLRRLIGEHVKIALRSDQSPARVLVDRGQLEQVIVNLAVNARDAMPDGGTLTIETHCRERSGRFRNAENAAQGDARVCLVVSDTGVGIAPHMVDRVFEPFFTTKQAGQGTGLGLATVYGIVTQSGGDVRIDSEPGNGTTVTVALPAAAADGTAGAATSAAERVARGGTETVLVCEDEPAVLAVIERTLRRYGYTVLAAGHPARALEVADAYRGEIDALVTDIVMPDMLGTELAMRLKARRPGLKILLSSGYSADALRDQASRPPESRFLAKPFQRTDLLQSLRTLLDRSVAARTDPAGPTAREAG
jgi:PAS domain S-box-containing protein